MMNRSEATESTNAPATKRLEWLDIAKGIAIFLVVVGHTVEHNTIHHLIFSFHMPAFFMLAGFTLRAKPWKVVVKSSAQRLLLPYVLIVVVAFLPSVFMSTMPLRMRALALAQALVYPAGYPSTQWTSHEMWAGVQLGYIDGGFYGIGMAWFLWCLFLARIMTNGILLIVARWQVETNPWVITAGAVGMIGLSLAMSHKPLGYWPLDFDCAVLAVGFMLFGQLLKLRDLVRPKFALAGVIAAIVWLVAAHYSTFEMSSRALGDNYVIAVCAALAGSYALCYTSLAIEAFRVVPVLRYGEMAIAWIGRHSLEIYAMHAIDGRLLMLDSISIGPLANSGIAKSLVRFGYDLLLVALIRKISK